jgi:hypothetical protein
VRVDRRVEVALEVPVTLLGRVVEKAAVELDQHHLAQRDVAVDHAAHRAGAQLPLPGRHAVRALDARHVLMLQHRVGPPRHVGEHALQELAARRPSPLGERLLHAHGSGVAALDGTSDRPDRVELAGRGEGHVQRGVVVAHPRWSQVPQRPVRQPEGAHHDDPVRRQHPALARHRDPDRSRVLTAARAVGGPHRRGSVQCRAAVAARRGIRIPAGLVCRAEQHPRPRPLDPRRYAGVVDEHARDERPQVATTYEPAQVVGHQSEVQRLAPGDHARLVEEGSGELVHA